MKVSIRVLPKSSLNSLSPAGPDGVYKAKLTAAPVDGAANAALIKLLSKSFGLPKSKIKIIRGLKSKNKIVEIEA